MHDHTQTTDRKGELVVLVLGDNEGGVISTHAPHGRRGQETVYDRDVGSTLLDNMAVLDHSGNTTTFSGVIAGPLIKVEGLRRNWSLKSLHGLDNFKLLSSDELFHAVSNDSHCVCVDELYIVVVMRSSFGKEGKCLGLRGLRKKENEISGKIKSFEQRWNDTAF